MRTFFLFLSVVFVGLILGSVGGVRVSVIGMVSLSVSLVCSAVSRVLSRVLLFSPLEMTWPFFVSFVLFRMGFIVAGLIVACLLVAGLIMSCLIVT